MVCIYTATFHRTLPFYFTSWSCFVKVMILCIIYSSRICEEFMSSILASQKVRYIHLFIYFYVFFMREHWRADMKRLVGVVPSMKNKISYSCWWFFGTASQWNLTTMWHLEIPKGGSTISCSSKQVTVVFRNVPCVFILHLLFTESFKVLRSTLIFCRHCFSIYHFFEKKPDRFSSGWT